MEVKDKKVEIHANFLHNAHFPRASQESLIARKLNWSTKLLCWSTSLLARKAEDDGWEICTDIWVCYVLSAATVASFLHFWGRWAGFTSRQNTLYQAGLGGSVISIHTSPQDASKTSGARKPTLSLENVTETLLYILMTSHPSASSR